MEISLKPLSRFRGPLLSRNPLSPNIAGPIAGVNITAPLLVSPANGALVKVDEQPIRVTFTNGESNGERPVFYDVTVSTTAEFTDIVHEATGIAPDPSGQTTHTLPAGLDPEQMYYWMAQADDGANASDMSGASTFEIYTPLEIEAPQIQIPTTGPNGSNSGTPTSLVITAPTVSGPANNVRWELQVAKDQAFNQVVVSLGGAIDGDSVTVDVNSLLGGTSQSSQLSLSSQSSPSLTLSALDARPRTSTAFAGLTGNTQYYWRARVTADGREGKVIGPWSARRTFTTPANPNELVSPTPLSPVGGSTASSNPPNLVVRNPSLGSLTGAITIRYQVATDDGFQNVVAAPETAMPSGSTTSVVTKALAVNKLHYWRARAVKGEIKGPWSPTRKFRPPTVTTTGGGGSSGGGSGSGSGGGGSSGGGSGGASDQLDLSQVTWLHYNVKNWPRTSTVTDTSIGNPPVCIDHTKRGQWPKVSAAGTTVEGNPWVFAKVNGKWYGATYEWLRPGQECKFSITAGSIGEHIKVSPLKDWKPKSGEKIGLMVSTPARFGPQGPKNERSNVVMVTWP